MLRKFTYFLFSVGFVFVLGSPVFGYSLLSMSDLSDFASHWLETDVTGTNGWQAWDINQDNVINFKDFAFLAQDSDSVFTDTDIAAGQYQMGDSLNEGSPDEMPVHPVYITQFSMSKFAVTNQQYVNFLDWAITYHQITVIKGVVYSSGTAAPSFPYCDTHDSNSSSQIDYILKTGPGSDMIINAFKVRAKAGRSMANDPVVMVSWYGATAYCNWLSQQRGIQPCYDLSVSTCDFTKGSYRLPTEAEWEYAAYGGHNFRFPFGDTISHYQANYFSSPLFFYDLGPTWGYNPAFNDGIFPYTAPVWSFKPNGFGLYNMAGNVSQWCNDWYCQACATPLAASNPTGPVNGMFRVFHGGGWDNTAQRCRITARGFGNPANRYANVGFRVVWNPFIVPPM